MKLTKTDKRMEHRRRLRYGHQGAGSCHTRQASDAEVLRHVEKARRKNEGKL